MHGAHVKRTYRMAKNLNFKNTVETVEKLLKKAL